MARIFTCLQARHRSGFHSLIPQPNSNCSNPFFLLSNVRVRFQLLLLLSMMQWPRFYRFGNKDAMKGLFQ
ncbi:hypothetical protein PUN4_140004 [Paraburkholderia unamae]|nr:hypothetical protein PUN4_140004 [Paraburkholderia unamae]